MFRFRNRWEIIQTVTTGTGNRQQHDARRLCPKGQVPSTDIYCVTADWVVNTWPKMSCLEDKTGPVNRCLILLRSMTWSWNATPRRCRGCSTIHSWMLLLSQSCWWHQMLVLLRLTKHKSLCTIRDVQLPECLVSDVNFWAAFCFHIHSFLQSAAKLWPKLIK